MEGRGLEPAVLLPGLLLRRKLTVNRGFTPELTHARARTHAQHISLVNTHTHTLAHRRSTAGHHCVITSPMALYVLAEELFDDAEFRFAFVVVPGCGVKLRELRLGGDQLFLPL